MNQSNQTVLRRTWAHSASIAAGFVVLAGSNASAQDVGVAALGTAQTVWTRANVTVTNDATPVVVLTVPATATKPYFLRQIFTDRYIRPTQYTSVGSTSACSLFVNGAFPLPLMMGAVTGMNIPFKAGDVVSISCSTYLNGYSPYYGFSDGSQWTLIFSNQP